METYKVLSEYGVRKVVKKSAQRFMVCGMTGAFPIKILVKNRMISFWLKMTICRHSKLSHRL